MAKWIDKIFRRKREDDTARQQEAQVSKPLRIEGTTQAPLTPEPDDAELAAQALLELLAQKDSGVKKVSEGNAQQNLKSETAKPETSGARSAAYYRQLAERMRQAHDQATLRTMRFVAWCEQELKKPDLPMEGKGSLQQMEVELYKRIDTVERVGGELKRRWQHCLATVIVRQMPATEGETE